MDMSEVQHQNSESDVLDDLPTGEDRIALMAELNISESEMSALEQLARV
jgi:hypothetical protein